uniref:Uncharacterized protein n=1 Tax=mine drainage metagenome TaxID=410659 RepID=E6QJB3_9ZZZZ
MANLQHTAERIFRHVDTGRLPVGYALAMGAIIDAHDDDPDFHDWADTVTGSTVEILIARMVRNGKWDDPAWLQEYIREASLKENTA